MHKKGTDGYTHVKIGLQILNMPSLTIIIKIIIRSLCPNRALVSTVQNHEKSRHTLNIYHTNAFNNPYNDNQIL